MLQCLELEVDSVEAKEAAQQRPSSQKLWTPKTHFRVVVDTRKHAGVLASSVYYCGPSFVEVIYHITYQKAFTYHGVVTRSRVIQKGIARFVLAIAI